MAFYRKEELIAINEAVKKNETIWVTGPTKPFEHDFIKIKQLANVGKYGVTYQCKRKRDGETVVVKYLNKNLFYTISIQHRHRYFKAMCDEFDVIKTLNHDYIIRVSDIYEDKTTLYIVMQECKGGKLFDRLCKRGTLTEKTVANIIKQLLQALRYMHDDNGIVHCNLKPDNILFLTEEESSPVKTIGFGMSKVLPRLQHLIKCGPPYYQSPEIIKNRKYNHACDMWSIGIILYIIIYGYPPFYVDPQQYGENERRAIYEKIIRGFEAKVKDTSVYGYGPWFPNHIRTSNEVKDLISKLLQRQVRKRYTAKEALTHPWIVNRANNYTINLNNGILKRFNDVCEYRLCIHKVFRNTFYKMIPQQFYDLEQLFMKCDRFNKCLITHENLMKSLDLINIEMIHRKQLNKAYKKLYFRNAAGFVVPYWFRRVINKPMLSIYDITNIIQMYYYDSLLCISVCERPIGIRYKELLNELVFEYLMRLNDRLYDAFVKLDDDNDGKILTKELTQKFQEFDVLGEYDKVIKVIQENGFDCNGIIDYEEFLFNLHPQCEEELEWMPDILKTMSSMQLKFKRKDQRRRKNGPSRKKRRVKHKHRT